MENEQLLIMTKQDNKGNLIIQAGNKEFLASPTILANGTHWWNVYPLTRGKSKRLNELGLKNFNQVKEFIRKGMEQGAFN